MEAKRIKEYAPEIVKSAKQGIEYFNDEDFRVLINTINNHAECINEINDKARSACRSINRNTMKMVNKFNRSNFKFILAGAAIVYLAYEFKKLKDRVNKIEEDKELDNIKDFDDEEKKQDGE